MIEQYAEPAGPHILRSEYDFLALRNVLRDVGCTILDEAYFGRLVARLSIRQH